MRNSPKKLPHHLKMEIIYICKGHKNRKESIKFLINALEDKDNRDPDTYTNTDLKKVLAVEAALAHLDPTLKKSIWNNVIERIPYEMLVVPIGRQGFYKERTNFIFEIASLLRYV